MNSLVARSLNRASQRNHLSALNYHFVFFSTKPKAPRPSKPTITTTAERAKDSETKTEWKRPKEIPFQPKVANSVSLIGYVHSPIQFQTASDGSSWAATVITQNASSHQCDDHDDDGDDHDSPDSLPLWVPVIFEGDLAHIAASHLKENDRVFVSGLLSSSLPHVNDGQVHASVQVMVHDINFIEKTAPAQKQKKILEAFIESERATADLSDSVSKNEDPVLSLWRDLVDNPKQWWDNRDAKRKRTVSPKYPDFKHKETSQVLWLNQAPKSILKKLQGLEFDGVVKKSKEAEESRDSKDPTLTSWKDLIENTKEWNDYRNSKLNGKVSPKYPDFKRKDGTGHPLWLDSAPQSIFSKLEGLEFDVPIQKPNEAKGVKVDDPWKDLVDNPSQWWDNRVGKRNQRAPDFKHKKTGAALWLSKSPAWVSPKLPPLKGTVDQAKGNI